MTGPVDDPPPVSPLGPVGDGRRSLFHRDRHEDEPPAAWCPRCGGEFLAGVARCDECGVALTSDPPDADDEPMVQDAPVVHGSRHDVVEYDLSAWTPEQGRELMLQLDLEHIPHAWRGRSLEIAGDHESKVDELIDAIDELDDVPDDVEYEFVDWTPQQCQRLVDRLVELGVVCRWDGHLLAIGSGDEPTVDAEVLKIDPAFPVSGGDEEPVDEEAPKGGGWFGIVADIADGISNIGR